MERLNFALPDFVRPSWVSDSAKGIWEPRINRVMKAWLEIEWLSVIDNIRPCGVTIATPDEFAEREKEWAKQGLSAFPIETQELSNYALKTNNKSGQEKSVVYRIVLGMPQSILDFKHAIDAGDAHKICILLGHPPCCYQFFRDVSMEQGLVDTTWPMATMTMAPPEGTKNIEVTKVFPETNVLWRWLGIRAVPHLPCRFDCPPSIVLGKKLVEMGRYAGYQDEMDWLLEILSWPVEWSALHGIAEIKTPILKISTRTDATGLKYVVRYKGDVYPSEGAQGLNFPYCLAHPQPHLTHSRGFKRGLDNPINTLDSYPE